MLLAELAATSRDVATTAARSEKTRLLARLFRDAEPAEARLIITYLAGRLPQRRIGAGWSVLREPRPPAPEPRLSVLEVDAAFGAIAAVSGSGALAERKRLVGALLEAATEEEQRFLLGLLSGEPRQGALDALAAEGLAAAPDAVELLLHRARPQLAQGLVHALRGVRRHRQHRAADPQPEVGEPGSRGGCWIWPPRGSRGEWSSGRSWSSRSRSTGTALLPLPGGHHRSTAPRRGPDRAGAVRLRAGPGPGGAGTAAGGHGGRGSQEARTTR